MITAWLLFFGWSTLFAMGLSLLFGQLSFWVAVVSLALGATVALKFKEPFVVPKRTRLGRIVLWLVIILAIPQIYFFYEKSGMLWITNPNNFGDLSWHLQQIRLLASGVSFWPENPALINERFRYPFGVNLFTALFEIFNTPTGVTFFIIGLFSLLCLVLLLENLGGWWLLIAFFFSGGWGSFEPGSTLAWKNLFLSVWSTQRGFLYALPVGLIFIQRIWFFKKPANLQIVLLLIPLAFFHLHSAFILGLLWILSILLDKKSKREWVYLAVVTLAWLPFVLNSVWGGQQLSSSLHSVINWMDSNNVVLSWIQNYHLYAVVLLLSLYFVRELKFRITLVLLLLFSHLILAPWNWDQIKILLWLYLLTSVYLYKNWLCQYSQKIQLVLAAVIFFPGFLQLLNSFPGRQSDVAIISSKEMEQALIVKNKVQVGERVLTYPTFNHPLAIVGVSLVAGYEGHLWSMGYQAKGLLEEINKIMLEQDDGRRFLSEYNVRWIYWGPHERKNWGEPPEWLKALPLIYGTAEASLYENRSWN